MEYLYRKRPFKTRNADEYDLSHILNLFVSPINGLATPFDYDNTIIKGRMGSGKTMFLRANYAYYIYRILPSLIEEDELILPVFIRLNDFQHLTDPAEIYGAIIIKIIEELSSIYLRVQDVKELARIHLGVKRVPLDLMRQHKMNTTLDQLVRLGAEQYVERISQQLEFKGSLKPKFFEASAGYKNNRLLEIQAKNNPGIKDVEDCFKTLLDDHAGRVLLLFDEAASLDRKFFRAESNDSFFEILMNQLRTAPYMRTKVAIYPNSYQDVLTETRYGDIVVLEESVMDQTGYERLRKYSIELIDNYLNPEGEEEYSANQVFDLGGGIHGDCLEQLLYASNGNLRRLIQLLDLSMERAFEEHGGDGKVETHHVVEAMTRHCYGTEGFYDDLEKEYLESILMACRNRSNYRFKFPYMSPILNKYTSRSQEYNLLNVLQVGSGRRGTTYAFDYCYCVAHDLPTHYIKGTQRIDRSRSLASGQWITRVTTISEEILKQTAVEDKREATITYYNDGKGFVKTDENKEYFFTTSFIIETDRSRIPQIGCRVRFCPLSFDENDFAVSVELLN